ncbi:MAG: CDP-glycerol glycerophosphotransferase family protein [Anaerolineales bacterium]|nr:CDP-glycerol glycerophosphotransferase family protein [Anaerolineales bacterium]
MKRLVAFVKQRFCLFTLSSVVLKLNFSIWLARLVGRTSLIINLSSIPLHFNFVKDLMSRLSWDRTFLLVVACDFEKDLVKLPDAARVIAARLIPFISADYVITLDTGFARLHPRSKLIHVPHSLASTHVIYPEGAFDHFDYIFCAGPHHLRELTTMLSQRGVHDCVLIPAGYEVVDRLISIGPSKVNTPPTVLFAPSWGESNVLVHKGVEVISTLLEEFEVILRPHAMNLVEDSAILNLIKTRFGSHSRFSLDISPDSSSVIQRADLLISDWSGIAFEYALAFLKPVIFIDGPMKVFNSNWIKYLLEPGVEKTEREKIGVVVQDIRELQSVARRLLFNADLWSSKIAEERNALLFNPTRCASVSHHALKLIASRQNDENWVKI